MSKQRVLFLCTGNSARSQMAEAFLRRAAGDIFEVHRAGLEPKGVHQLTVKVMAEAGIDISDQTSKGIETYLAKTLFQYLITVCDDADQNCPTIWPGLSSRLHWSFEDPAKFEGNEEQKLGKFREVRDLIEERIRHWVLEQYIFADY
jgi:arsenate reductase